MIFFPTTQPMHLQGTYIDGKLLGSALLYRHGTSEAGKSDRVC